MVYEIRAGTKRDIEAVALLDRTANKTHWTKMDYVNCLHNPLERLYVLTTKTGWIFKRERIIGLLVVWLKEQEAEIAQLVIATEYQNQGCGTKLLQYVLNSVLPQEKVIKTFLEVRADNPRAKQLYERLLFKEIGYRKDYYQLPDGKRGDAITMMHEKNITS